MANDYRFGITVSRGLSLSWTTRFLVGSGTTASISAGAPTKCTTADGSVAGVVACMADGDGIVTGQRFTGLAKDTSTETTSAAGVVNTWAPVPGMVYLGRAKSATAANTQAKIDALMGKKVIFDLTSNVWTVDTGATDALVNCLVICGGNPATNEVEFIYSPKGTIFDTSTAM